MNEKRRIKSKLGIDAQYIPNGVMINKIYKEIHYNDYIFFASGRIIHSKGCDILLKALHKLKYNGKILIAGDLDQTSEYKKEITNLAKGLNVSFLGLIKNKNKLLSYCKNANLFVFPSSIEAMSMMLLEAASQKVPIIASDIVENKDVFSDNEVLFFKTDNVDDLAEKINWALSNSKEMVEKADNAYKKLMKGYTWDKISDKYSACYDFLMAEK